MWKMAYNGHKPYALVKDGLLEMSNGSRRNFSSTVKVHLLMINASCHFLLHTLENEPSPHARFQADKQQTIQSSGAHAAEVLEGLSIRYPKLLCTNYPILSKRIFAPIIFPPKNAAPSKRTRKKILIFKKKKNWGHFRETELNSMTSICTVCVCVCVHAWVMVVENWLAGLTTTVRGKKGKRARTGHQMWSGWQKLNSS